ncbi:hypothetical protein GCM10023238_27580 [Streptomyces heliomycini]
MTVSGLPLFTVNRATTTAAAWMRPRYVEDQLAQVVRRGAVGDLAGDDGDAADVLG